MAANETKSIDWDYFLGQEGRRWKPSPIRALFPKEKLPGMISLLAGKPNGKLFPYESISFKVSGTGEEIDIKGADLDTVLQYGMTPGLPKLVVWLRELQRRAHKRDHADGTYDVVTGDGSQDLLNKVFESLLDPGDSVIVESPAYPGLLSVLRARPSTNIVEAPMDSEGLVPDELEDILADWFKEHPNKHFPKALYTVPTASNPSGCSTPFARRQRIYDLAKKYNFLIVEDDAYAFLRFDPTKSVPTYFEIDGQQPLEEQGRVIRCDTFSKVISAGMRLGFLSAAPRLIENVNNQTGNQILHPSSITGAVAEGLFEHWGHDGFFDHCKRVSAFYKEQCIMAEKYARKHLDGLAKWVSPDGGMFLYLELNLPESVDTQDLLMNEGIKEGVLAVPGAGFSATFAPSHNIRISYSLSTEEQFDEGFRRLATIIKRVNDEHGHTARFESVPERKD